MRRNATRQSLLTIFQKNQAGSHSHLMLSVQNVWRCAGVGCWAHCAVVQYCRCPRRNQQDAANKEKKCPSKMEGGRGVGGEREGLAQTLPECHHLVCFILIRWKRRIDIQNRCRIDIQN